MMATTRVKTEGLRQLGETLKAYEAKVQGKITRNAATTGARVIREDAKRRVPVLAERAPHRKPGTIKKNIRMRVMPRTPKGVIEVIIGVRDLSRNKITKFKSESGQAAAQNPDDPYYWRFVEFGTVKMAAMPFLRPAYDAKKEEAAAAVQKQLKERLEAEATKAKK